MTVELYSENNLLSRCLNAQQVEHNMDTIYRNMRHNRSHITHNWTNLYCVTDLFFKTTDETGKSQMMDVLTQLMQYVSRNCRMDFLTRRIK